MCVPASRPLLYLSSRSSGHCQLTLLLSSQTIPANGQLKRTASALPLFYPTAANTRHCSPFQGKPANRQPAACCTWKCVAATGCSPRHAVGDGVVSMSHNCRGASPSAFCFLEHRIASHRIASSVSFLPPAPQTLWDFSPDLVPCPADSTLVQFVRPLWLWSANRTAPC